jgi:hypothetical protein
MAVRGLREDLPKAEVGKALERGGPTMRKASTTDWENKSFSRLEMKTQHSLTVQRACSTTPGFGTAS